MARASQSRSARPRPLHQAVVAAAAAWRARSGGRREHHLLAVAVRALAFDTARRITRASDADDVANEVAFKCLAALEEGRVGVGSEASYVVRAAHHRACSGFRAQRRFVPADLASPDEGAGSRTSPVRAQLTSPSPCDALGEHAERLAHEHDLEALARVIACAPAPHREVLEAHAAGVTTKQLVARALPRAGAASDADHRSESRLRAALDQRFCRAKGWVRKHWPAEDWADVA